MRLRIALTNILHKAIRFHGSTPGHVPKLEIALKQNDKDFTITISDNGEGIPPEVMPKIFDMFYRAT
jgi:signal transduction histidine kinase